MRETITTQEEYWKLLRILTTLLYTGEILKLFRILNTLLHTGGMLETIQDANYSSIHRRNTGNYSGC